MYDPIEVATYYIAAFPARSDVYSRWTDAGWRPVRSIMTPQLIVDGWTRRGPAISGYMISPENTTHSLAIDFDTDNGLEQAHQLAVTMTQAGLPAYVETSRRGAHLWALVDGEVPARAARKALRALLSAALLPTDDDHIEIRPGSDSIEPGGLGHALRLPFMPHPKTGKQPSFYDAGGNRLGPSIASILLDIQWGDPAMVELWASRWSVVTTHLPRQYREPRDYGPDEYENASASDILRQLWGVERAAPGRSVRCPAHDDRVASLSILKDDRRVICKAPHCELNNDDHGRGTFELTQIASQRHA